MLGTSDGLRFTLAEGTLQLQDGHGVSGPGSGHFFLLATGSRFIYLVSCIDLNFLR